MSLSLRHLLFSCLTHFRWLNWGFVFFLICDPSISHCTPSHPHRLDLSLSYTRVDQAGDWQRLIAGYGYMSSQKNAWGGSFQAHRREFSLEPFTDLMGTMWGHWQSQNWSIHTQIEGSLNPKFMPKWAVNVHPQRHFKIKTHTLTLASYYRFAQYSSAWSQLVVPSLTWIYPYGSIGTHLYFTFPEYGPNFFTPQLRFTFRLSYFWRLGLWGLYGYDTLNDRFVDPRRQSPLTNLYVYIQHLWNDWQGTRVGLSYLNFLPQNRQQAQERFNQNRLEFSLHHYWRFD